MNYNQEVLNIIRKYKPDEYQVYENLFIDFLQGKYIDFSDEKVKFIKHVYGRLLTDNTFNIENSFKLMEDRGWDSLYIFIDVHKTILYPAYEGFSEVYYPMAKETLQKLTNDKRFKLVLYTCSYKEDIDKYIRMFETDNIIFDFINKSDVSNNRYGDFSQKSYKNILLDDVAGFVCLYDWFVVNNCI